MSGELPAHTRAAYAAFQRERAALEAEPSPFDALRLRREMHRATGIDFLRPTRYGTGWQMDSREPGTFRGHTVGDTRVLLSWAPYGADWGHASISHPDRDPTYAELAALHVAAFPWGYAYQVFAPPERHVNIHPFALHLWGRLDGANVLPDFGALGSI